MHGWVTAGITTIVACTPASYAVSSASDSVTKILLPLLVRQRVGDLLDLKPVEACAVCSFASIAKPADADLWLRFVAFCLISLSALNCASLASLWFALSSPPPVLLQ